MDAKWAIEPVSDSVYSEIDKITRDLTNRLAAAVSLPAHVLYGSIDHYVRLHAPLTHDRIRGYSSNGIYAIVYGKDVFDRVLRSAPAPTSRLAKIWLNELEEHPRDSIFQYRGPVSGSRCYVIVKVLDMVRVEREDKVRRDFEEEIGLTVDGLDRETIFHYYKANQQETPAPPPGVKKLYFTLTPRQIAVAKEMWSEQLRKKVAESAAKDRRQITCQSQYDLDE